MIPSIFWFEGLLEDEREPCKSLVPRGLTKKGFKPFFTFGEGGAMENPPDVRKPML